MCCGVRVVFGRSRCTSCRGCSTIITEIFTATWSSRRSGPVYMQLPGFSPSSPHTSHSALWPESLVNLSLSSVICPTLIIWPIQYNSLYNNNWISATFILKYQPHLSNELFYVLSHTFFVTFFMPNFFSGYSLIDPDSPAPCAYPSVTLFLCKRMYHYCLVKTLVSNVRCRMSPPILNLL